jgi:DNA-directed RNA polymerase specialized sigma24 family protein
MNFSLTNGEFATIKAVARSSSRKWSLVELEDLEQELILWGYENADNVIRYRKLEDGPTMFLIALRRKANQYCSNEQALRSGEPLDFHSKYSIEQIERALVSMYHVISTQAVAVDPNTDAAIEAVDPFSDEVRTTVLDVARAFGRLDKDLKDIIELKYRDEATFRDMGLLLKISAPGARKRLRKALRRIQAVL